MKEKTKRWKIILPIVLSVLLVVGIVSGFLYNIDKNRVQVNVAEAIKGDVVKLFSASAPVESASSSVFYAIDGVRVLDLKVKVGDVVEQGTQLASFDTSSLSEKQEEMQRAADNAKTAYNDAVKAAESAKEALPALEAEIEKISNGEGVSAEANSSSSSFDMGSILGSLGGILGGGGSFDMSAMLGDEFASQSQLAQLQIQKIVLETQMSDSYLNNLKQKKDSEEAALNIFLSHLNLLKQGWVAEKRGIVSAVNIEAGQTFSSGNGSGQSSSLDISSIMGMLSGDVDMNSLISMFGGLGDSSAANTMAGNIGIVVENYDEFYAAFSLGKYDMETIKLGQRAKVFYIDNEYEGEVSFVSATANSSDSFNISSIMGGVSGSSSAAEGVVTIHSPDEGIVLGFDVDIDIITDEVFDVLTLPVEAIRWTPEGEASVYVYNPKSKKIQYREILTGISDSTSIEILSGLEEGDLVVRNVLSGSSKLLEDDTRVKVRENNG